MRTSFFGAGPCSLLGRSVMEKLPLASEERTERGLRSTAIAESRRVAQQRTGLSDEGADMARTRRSRPTALEVHPSSSRVRIRCRGTQVPRRRLRDEHREGCLRQDLIMISWLQIRRLYVRREWQRYANLYVVWTGLNTLAEQMSHQQPKGRGGGSQSPQP